MAYTPPAPTTTHTPVLIVGGGPVGLALALELGWRGVSCLLIEQGSGDIDAPKMNEVNTRSMEFCRRWGIADAVRACPFPADYPMVAPNYAEQRRSLAKKIGLGTRRA